MNLSSVDTQLMKALAHPLRQRILMELNQRVASPSELAEEIGEPLGNVSYHVRMLVDLECIELVSTTPRRGALEHHYRATVRPIFDEETWATMPGATRRAVMSDILKAIYQSISSAGDAGSFDDEKAHVASERLVLDAKGWDELAEVLVGVHDRAREIAAQSAKRMGKDRSEALESALTIMHYRAAEPQKAKPKKRSTKKPAAKR